MTENGPKADWYPDPDDPTTLRYWDGSAWTSDAAPVLESTSPSVEVPVDTHVNEPDAQPTSGRPGWLVTVAAIVLLVGLVAGLFFALGRGGESGRAIEPLVGQELWRVDSPFADTPTVLAVADGVVVLVGAEDCGEDCGRQLVSAVDIDSGNSLWSAGFDADSLLQIGGIKGWVVQDLLLIDPFSRGTSELVALDLRSGEEQWRADVGSTIGPDQLREFGDLIVAEGPVDRDLVALDIETGSEQWTYVFDGDDSGRIESVGSDVLVIRRQLRSLDSAELQGVSADGMVVWQEEVGVQFGPILELNPPGDADIRVSREGDQAWAFDPATGETLWSYRFPFFDEAGTFMVVDYQNERVLMTALEGQVVSLAAVDLSSGDELWIERLVMNSELGPGEDPTIISWTESTALVADSTGFVGPLRVVAVDLASGARLWDTTIGDQDFSIVRGPVLAGIQGDLFSVRTGQAFVLARSVTRAIRLDVNTGDLVEVDGGLAVETLIDADQVLRVESGDDSARFQVVGTDTFIDLALDRGAGPLTYVEGVLLLADENEIVGVG